MQKSDSNTLTQLLQTVSELLSSYTESDRKKIQHVEGGEVLSTAMYVSKEIAETQ